MPSAFQTRQVPSVSGDRPPAIVYYILPKSLAKPVWLAIFGFLPWALLLAVNLWLLYPVWGEMSPDQLHHTGIWLGAGVTMGLLNLGVAIFRGLRREMTKLPELAGLTLLTAGYLWLTVDWIMGGEIVPASVTRWILPPDNLLGIQFSLATPPMFYALLRLACFETRSRFLAGPVASIIAVVAGPSFLFISGAALSFLSSNQFLQLPYQLERIVSMILLVGVVPLTLMVLAGVLRLGAGIYLWSNGMAPWKRALIHGTFCLLMPMGGLLLNREIPFPTDFQSPLIYLLTFINGAVLTWPAPVDTRWRNIRWLALATLFPFSLYFFIVFLPWMPLTLPAMIVMGAGFLILAPIILFAVHVQELLRGWEQSLDEGNRILPWISATCALAILPGFLLFQALMDRAALRQALDYAYRSPYQSEVIPVDAKRAAATLQRMRDMQQGLYLPFLSNAYKSLVFDGMVLQQEKILQLHRMFSGKELPAVAPNRFMGFFANEFGSQDRATFNPFTNGRVVARPLLSPASGELPGGWTRYVLDLDLRNEVAEPGEFTARIQLPEGIWVTGLELDLNGTMVPARIFEKKTALWVYQKIRDTEYRRDPGLAFYVSPGLMEVRVFPFTAHQSRPARLTLLAAPGVKPDLLLKDIAVPQTPASPEITFQEHPHSLATPAGTVVLLPPNSAPAAPRARRLHFIVDRSVDGLKEKEVEAIIRRVVAASEISDFQWSEANYRLQTHEKSQNGTDLALVFNLPQEGGFSFDRAVKTIMAQEAQSSAASPEAGPATFFVAVTRKPENVLTEERGKAWLSLAEDAPVYGEATPGWLSWKRWRDRKETELPPPVSVILVKSGQILRSVIPDARTRILEFPGGADDKAFLYQNENWTPLTSLEGTDARTTKAMEAWMAALNLDYFPERENALFAEAVNLSREAGVLTPPTSLMIVENSAQWKMLERQEKKKTDTAKEFDFEEAKATPEPATWILLVITGIMAWIARHFGWLRKRTAS